MVLAQLFLQSEVTYDCVNALGELGLVQFRDMNPDVNAFQRKYVNDVRRCDEMDRKLRFFQSQIEKAEMKVQSLDAFAKTAAPETSEIATLEGELEQFERELKELNANDENLKRQELELTELRAILRNTGTFFEEADAHVATAHGGLAADGDHDTPLLVAPDADRTSQLGFVTGVISRNSVPGFERLLWRACRGNVFLRSVAIPERLKDPSTNEDIHKDVFIVFFQGEQLENRVRRICDGYNATLYPCPGSAADRREMAQGVQTRIADLQRVVMQTSAHRRGMLQTLSTKLPAWTVKVMKAKAIFVTMNKFNIDVTRRCLIAECWCPTERVRDIREALRVATERSGGAASAILNVVETHEAPPTYHLTNKYTEGFQSIVDAYGVASYREVNPGPFTIITFPFLFAVMFGDFGHGVLMFLAAFFLVYKEDQLRSFKGGEIWDTMFGGRYIIFLMGAFSIYTGFLYNDFFSKPVTLASSGWVATIDPQTALATGTDGLVQFHPDKNFTHAYVLGIDPIWPLAENKLTFINSFKMKLSVILGITHMGFGVILSSFNHRFFHRPLDLYFSFIPQCFFLFCIFGYLCIMIVYKWVTPSFPKGVPSLLLMLINMFLKFGKAPEEVLYGSADGSSQAGLQTALVLLAVFAVPFMLFVKPCVLNHRHKKMVALRGPNYHEEEEAHGHGGGHGHGGKFEFGEVMVHQAIHTIEFCLGCISNTASYLRLWALSLAHAQLSEVLWDMVLEKGFGGFYLLYPAFAVWAVLTVAVLLIMEGLSAFLHALRLHWVEFQNKFYEGNGYKFMPFAFEKIVQGASED